MCSRPRPLTHRRFWAESNSPVLKDMLPRPLEDIHRTIEVRIHLVFAVGAFEQSLLHSLTFIPASAASFACVILPYFYNCNFPQMRLFPVKSLYNGTREFMWVDVWIL